MIESDIRLTDSSEKMQDIDLCRSARLDGTTPNVLGKI